jgi:cobalt-zinc-cadmium efflux system protein
VVSAIVIYFTGWRQVDPIVAVAIGLWILPRSWSLLSESINILLEGVPQGLAVDAIHRKLMAISGVADVHDLHVWSITTGKNTLTAHLTLDASAGDPQSVLREARAAIEEFGITHSTVQIETARCEPGPDCNLGAHPPHSH